MLCNQFRHTASGSSIYRVNIYRHTLYKQIHPVVYFLPVKIVQKQEELSIYF